MSDNRRDFMKAAPVALAAGVGGFSARASSPHPSPSEPARILDYGLSLICNTATFNAVRFCIESRTTLIDDAEGTSEVFYQCASCKSENTFAEKDLFSVDNYDFMPILGGRNWLIFRRPCGLSERYRGVSEDVWGEPVLKLRYGKQVAELTSFESIRDATSQGQPIVAHTEIQNEDNQLRAVIEYPVKTMNVSLDKSLYQVDTGPIAFPDLSKRFEPLIDCLSLAFVAFNTSVSADFIIEQPTSVMREDVELAQIYHYSKPFNLTASNRLYALKVPDE